MTASGMIRQLCKQKNISLAELCRHIGQTPQNFNKKLKRNTISLNEIFLIAKVLNVYFEQAFIFPDDNKIHLTTKGGKRCRIAIKKCCHFS